MRLARDGEWRTAEAVLSFISCLLFFLPAAQFVAGASHFRSWMNRRVACPSSRCILLEGAKPVISWLVSLGRKGCAGVRPVSVCRLG